MWPLSHVKQQKEALLGSSSSSFFVMHVEGVLDCMLMV
jgi:hypothetical protein